MFVRQLVQAWIRQAAQEQLRDAVSGIPRGGPVEGESQSESEAARDAPPPEVGVLFALGVESGGLVDRLQDVTRRRFKTRTEFEGALQGRRVLVVESGVGTAAAERATKRILERYSPAWVISAGFAGALRDDLRRGHVIMADSVLDAAGNELQVGLKMDAAQIAGTRGLHVGPLLTVDRIVRTADEKRTLAGRHKALACDMETFAVAHACQEHKTRFLAVRIVTDALDDELPPELEALVSQKSSAGRLGAAAGAIFRRPSSVKDMWRLKEEAIKASDRLAKFLEGVLPQLQR